MKDVNSVWIIYKYLKTISKYIENSLYNIIIQQTF